MVEVRLDKRKQQKGRVKNGCVILTFVVFCVVYFFSIASGPFFRCSLAALEAQKELGFEQKDIDDIRSMITDTSINYLILILIATVTHTVLEVASVKSSYVFWRDNESLEGLSLIYVLGDFFSQGEVGSSRESLAESLSVASLPWYSLSLGTHASGTISVALLLVLRSLTNPSPLS